MNPKIVSLGLSLLALSAAAASAAPGPKPDADAKAELRRAIRNDELPRGENLGRIEESHSSVARSEVEHEMSVARANGEMVAPGEALGSELPQRVQSVASRTEVKQQFALARANDELMEPGEAPHYGMPSHQAHGLAAGSSQSIFAILKKDIEAKDGQ